jgi:AraC-like DNA-binding protein
MASKAPLHTRSTQALARRYAYLPDRVRKVHRSGSIQDYLAEPFEGPSPYPEVEAITSLGGADHYEVRYASPFATGRSEFCAFADGFFVAFGDCAFGEPYEVSVTAPDMLRILVGKARGEYAAADDESVQIDGPCALLVVEPAGSPPASCAFEGPLRTAQIYLTRQVLAALYAGDEENLPGVLQAFLAGALQRAVVRRLPLTAPLLRCVEDLLTSDCEGRTRRHFIQSKAMEIFCHVFDALGLEDGFGSGEASVITSRGVLKAQAILMQRYVCPPSLDDLAREVGLSRTALTAGFRTILGQSVFGYIQDLRMQHALALLKAPGSTITEVAFAVGYTHVSSFSVAVQRRLGVSPRDLRRRVVAEARAD